MSSPAPSSTLAAHHCEVTVHPLRHGPLMTNVASMTDSLRSVITRDLPVPLPSIRSELRGATELIAFNRPPLSTKLLSADSGSDGMEADVRCGETATCTQEALPYLRGAAGLALNHLETRLDGYSGLLSAAMATASTSPPGGTDPRFYHATVRGFDITGGGWGERIRAVAHLQAATMGMDYGFEPRDPRLVQLLETGAKAARAGGKEIDSQLGADWIPEPPAASELWRANISGALESITRIERTSQRFAQRWSAAIIASLLEEKRP